VVLGAGSIGWHRVREVSTCRSCKINCNVFTNPANKTSRPGLGCGVPRCGRRSFERARARDRCDLTGLHSHETSSVIILCLFYLRYQSVLSCLIVCLFVVAFVCLVGCLVCLFVFISGTMRFSRYGLGASYLATHNHSAIPEVTLKSSY
jgi:hypothetical protein